MTRSSERVARLVMYLTVLFITVFPTKYYILSIESWYSFYCAVFICCSGSLTLVYATLCLCYRGYVVLKDFTNIELSPESRSCHICMQFKPERSHHCSTCKKCIKKMDHHCHWLGRCINYDNHGHFVRFLLCMFLNSSAVFAFNSYYLVEIIKYDSYQPTQLMWAILLLSFTASLLLMCVSCFHLHAQVSMILLNITFIESINCYNYGYSETDSPYNLGLRHNIEDVFGPLKYFLLGSPRGNGIFFRKKYCVEYWPKHFRSIDRAYEKIII
ncbi:uncharacterized protein VICG_00119 [Vittaforma corneae ATCC 50505]|uniref:Palmitoyltransferase n=1 Tax=Vittaforma corneae (strain ATCC 50505) TaxID=993615 RepID=L2GQB2_VITCO|nr:uncharacterized protein VICG_00119 [Vittaforma corneae ATCC 50505]ELA42804.1 hypothetical protein VICG_00119 [Vittaforma corneae ATCC 50505]